MRTKGNYIVEANLYHLQERQQKLLYKFEALEAELQKNWNPTKWRERNILAHKIEVTEQRLKGQWECEELRVYEVMN